jgi:chemotaxis protein MotB
MRRNKPSIFKDAQETDRWLISYADFITLLFAFFVVMYSISQVNESKYKVLSDSLTQAFENPRTSLQPIPIGEVSRSLQPITGDDIEQPELNSDNSESGNIDVNNLASTEEFKDLENGLRRSLGDLIDQDLAEINSDANWINITLRSGLLFPSGSDQLNPGAEQLLEEVVKHIESNNQKILVHGHTDNIPISTERFPSNWDLSSARAVAVVRNLQKLSIYAPRMAVEGHGEYQPIAPNDNAENRAKNRRVVISISRKQQVIATDTAIDTSTIASSETENQNAEKTAEQTVGAAKDAEKEFEIITLPGGGILIRGKDLPTKDEN